MFEGLPEHALLLYAPLIVSGVLHMLVVKYDLLAALKMPIDAKRLGPNKTVRGFVFVPLVNALVFWLVAGRVSGGLAPRLAWVGAALGFAYMLFELPNSYVKRRLGIAAGARGSRYTVLVDKADSAFGVSLTYTLIHMLPARYFVALFAGAFLTHLSVSALLVVVGWKQSL